MLTINILGTEYEIHRRKSFEDVKLADCCGYIDHTAKQIVVEVYDAERDPNVANTVADLVYQEKSTTRHEIVHAFFYESGLWSDDYGKNEELVDWIALQAPKMLWAFEQAGAL